MSRKPKVSVYLRIRLDGKQRYHAAVWDSKKRLKDHICHVGDATANNTPTSWYNSWLFDSPAHQGTEVRHRGGQIRAATS